MAERDPLTDETKGIRDTTAEPDAKGAKAAAQGAGNPEVPSVGDRAESHHVAHANSKAGAREDENDVEDNGNEGNHMGRDVINQNPIADEEDPMGQKRNVA